MTQQRVKERSQDTQKCLRHPSVMLTPTPVRHRSGQTAGSPARRCGEWHGPGREPTAGHRGSSRTRQVPTSARPLLWKTSGDKRLPKSCPGRAVAAALSPRASNCQQPSRLLRAAAPGATPWDGGSCGVPGSRMPPAPGWEPQDRPAGAEQCMVSLGCGWRAQHHQNRHCRLDIPLARRPATRTRKHTKDAHKEFVQDLREQHAQERTGGLTAFRNW